MNRIREIRLARGLTESELARRVGTSQPQIRRLEAGQRRLTEEWMRRIAKALDVRPADLLATVTAADFQNELAPCLSDDPVYQQLAGLGFSAHKVLADSVASAGIAQGDTIILTRTPQRLERLMGGDIVAVQATLPDGARVLLLRQYLPPGLLTTNRPGTNLAFTLDRAPIPIEIVGVADRPRNNL